MLKIQCLIVFSIIVLVNAQTIEISSSRLEDEWSKFKNTYGHQYRSIAEEQYRKKVFANNLEFIEKHNQLFKEGKSSFELGINKFADRTNSEFRKLNGLELSKNSQPAPHIYDDNDIDSLPDEIDWTTKGVVAPVKDQGMCGSCWAFSAVGSMESAHAIATGKLVQLSEQELVDCSRFEGNEGCSGGLMDYGFKFVIDKHGIDTEKSYPYKGIDETCKMNQNKTIGATIRSYVDVKQFDEKALQSACAKVGPISVAIDASSTEFGFYKSGVFDYSGCSQMALDHGVVVVGYGTEKGKQYWKVRNSWGKSWGKNGYILMSRNKHNQCGIATKASYPVV